MIPVPPRRAWLLAAALLLCARAADASLALRNQARSARLERAVSGLLPPDGLFSAGVSVAGWTVTHGEADAPFQVDGRRLSLDLEYGLRPGIDLRARVPWRAWSGGRYDLPAEGSGPGDVEAGLLLALPSPGDRLGAALDLRASLPTGAEADGLGQGELSPYVGLALSAAFWERAQMPEMRLHLNLGRRLHPLDGGFGAAGGGRLEPWPPLYPAVSAGGAASDNDAWVIAGALEFRKSKVTLFVEYVDEHYGDGVEMSLRERPRSLGAGLRWGGEEGAALEWGYEVPLGVDDPSTPFVAAYPDFVLRAGLGWSFAVGGSDRDGDGVPDRVDRCPDAPEDLDGHLDDDGCPDPDNDEDGIPDVDDLAPDYPEDHDGFADDDGVPDPDNDRDGIPDVIDDCPDMAEDFDGHRDEDGCPEEFLDADGDGIEDAEDDCPHEAEDFDDFEDGDGCPEEDNDLDGVPDAVDACPCEAEDYDGVEDDDGCPE